MSARKMYRYSATVNGKPRSVIFWADADDLGRPLTLDDAELIVFNDHDLYKRFYERATQEDYDAARHSEALEVQIPARWEKVTR